MATAATVPRAAPGTLCALLLACASAAQAGDIVLEIDPASIVPIEATNTSEGQESPPAAPLVEVSDIRDETSLERTPIGQVSLGQIEVVPPLPQLVGAIVSAKASGIALEGPPGGEPPVIYCELRRFSIQTPATLFYWDIVAHIEIVLRVGDRDGEVTTSAKARTWVYPSETLLETVTRDALVKLAEELDPALRALLLPPPAEQDGEREPRPASEPHTEPVPEP